MGSNWKHGNGASIVGAHTDSPCFRVKPNANKSAEGYLSVGVETYGGGIWHTWFDRDLSIAGRVITQTGPGQFEARLLKLDKPILRIPTLAIHLDHTANQKLEINKENNMQPILAVANSILNSPKEEETEALSPSGTPSISQRQHSVLLQLVKEGLDLKSISEIRDFELLLYDTQPSCLGGLDDQFIFSARLDNLNQSFCAVKAIVEASDSIDKDENIRMISLFDHEEIGSLTAQGADSNFLPSVLTRIMSQKIGSSEPTPSSLEESLSRTFLVSADMAHAVNPNYAAKYESLHKPILNGGPVVKINANARYATNSPGIVLMEECARRANVPIQRFVVRNDSSCGSTIGPMLSAKLGIRTLDLGNPQLSMHSVRETCGSHDVEKAILLFKSFFESFGELEASICANL